MEARLVAVHRVEYHVAVVVQLVVRQLQLVEGHHLHSDGNFYRVTKVLGDTDYVEIKMRVADI